MLKWSKASSLLTAFIFASQLAGCVSQTTYVNSEKPFYNTQHSPEEAASNRISLGLKYLEKGNSARAKLNIDKAIELAPDMAQAHYTLAYYYQVVKEYEKADQTYQKVIRMAPNNADALNNYGVFLCQQGQIEKAQQMLQAALEVESYVRVAQTYENLGICLFDHDREQFAEKTIQYLQRALAHDARRLKSIEVLQQIFAEQKNWAQALYYSQRALDIKGIDADSLWNAYKLAILADQQKQAQEYARVLLTRFASSAQAEKLRQTL
ncbi:type IV pilus biogenesis/stability protein PilW [Gayadomonas joobiniege]|uniref:type IV pilus biogenesis/stability protein PilW n=1 Tax=Gayadomonas joobiniege TaxID=1234606 RepID=UPI00036413B2|nr:type IV pilus biogenesis/stability protein PilW [Gayadomonas joobiniege]